MQVVEQILYKMHDTFTKHETKNKYSCVCFLYKNDEEGEKKTTLIKKGHVEFQKK